MTRQTALFYDTETTGLPNWSVPSDDPSQPSIIQLAAELVDLKTREVLDTMSHIIKPAGWVISQEITDLTGITMEQAEAVGIPIEEALAAYLAMLDQSTVYRVAHNEPFDARMMRIEFMRGRRSEQFLESFKKAPTFCTCSSSTKIVNLPPTAKMLAAKRNTPKQPTLEEAYKFFTGLSLEGAHNAGVDVMGCKAVYFAIHDHHASVQASEAA